MYFIKKEEELTKTHQFDQNISDLNCVRNIYIEDDYTLIKSFDKFNLDQLIFLYNIPEHKSVLKPTDIGVVINSEKINIAYRMKFLKNAQTLKSLYNQNIPYEEKLNYANQLFPTLKFLHQYLIIGDIYNKNILINNGKAYFRDLDFSKPTKKPFSQIYCYYYLSLLRSYENTKYTDILKLYIEFLSLILEIDFSKFISEFGYRNFYKVISSYDLPTPIKTFLKNKPKRLGNDAYNFEQFMTPDILELKRSLNFFKQY